MDGSVRPGAPAPLVVTLRVNGAARKATVEPRTTLLDALRERLGMMAVDRRARVTPAAG